MSAPVRIDGRLVGPGAPAYLVAEIGLNHNGDMELARRTIDAAREAGADAVKFQSYRTEDFVSDRTLTYSYTSGGRTVTESQYDMFKRCELDEADLAALAAHCAERGIGFHSTPTSADGVRALVALGVGVLKNGSDYLGHLPLVTAMGESGLPTVLSTGMATVEEIDEAVAAFRATGNAQLILLHCTSQYPTPAADVNLAAMTSLAERYGCLTGFSDHTDGAWAAAAAVARGACWIEKHFTLDRELLGPDHRFSADRAAFGAMVEAVRYVERALGSPAIGPTDGEQASRSAFRLSCVAARALPSGHRLSADDIAFRRPGDGLRPAEQPSLLGRTLVRDLAPGEPIRREDLA